MNFTVPPLVMGLAGLAAGVLLVLAILDIIGGKEKEALKKIVALIVALALFVDGITNGAIRTAIANKIAQIIGQI